jgi:hypothetical protein
LSEHRTHAVPLHAGGSRTIRAETDRIGTDALIDLVHVDAVLLGSESLSGTKLKQP